MKRGTIIQVLFISFFLVAFAQATRLKSGNMRSTGDKKSAKGGKKSAKGGKKSKLSHDEDDEWQNKVAVVGAGISGLVAARELEKLGYLVTVFEAEDRVGGKIESVYLDPGMPSTGFLDLTPEAEAAAFDLCGNKSPTELGAVYTSEGGTVHDMVEEFQVPYGRIVFENKVAVAIQGQTMKFSSQEYIFFLAQQRYPDATPSEIGEVIQNQFVNYQAVALSFPEILSSRLDGQSQSDLALPMTEFAVLYDIDVLIESIRPFITGYGYGYFDTVPAAYLLKLIHLFVAAGGVPNLIGFPCGFQSLPEAIAASLEDVRLNAMVETVVRKEDYFEVKAVDQKKERFNYVVISTTLDLIPRFMDVGKSKNDMFNRIKTVRYIVTVTDITDDVGEAKEVDFFASQGIESNINHITALGRTKDNDVDAENVYQIIDGTIALKDAYEILEDDLESYFGSSPTGVIARGVFPNYFPTVSTEDFAGGFLDVMEDLQGEDDIYYVGGQLSFETVGWVVPFARELILRKFAPIV